MDMDIISFIVSVIGPVANVGFLFSFNVIYGIIEPVKAAMDILKNIDTPTIIPII